MTHTTVSGEWSPFPGPPGEQFEGDTLLERISRAYEAAVDAAGEAFDDEAVAENAYLLEASRAWAVATEDGIAITARQKHVDHQPEVVATRMEWNRAIAKRKRCALKAQELEHRSVMAMSHNRFVREATGG